MNSQQAKEVLSLYRPGTADAEDASFTEALRLCERDPELNRWLDEHCAVYEALRSKFKRIPVPEGLKEQILAERIIHTTPAWQRRPFILAAVAVVAVLTGLVYPRLLPREDTGFAVYRERMTGAALRGYAMNLVTNNPVRVRAYLAQNAAPSYYTLPAPLEQATLTGCAILKWQGAKVSMVCFRSGRPLRPGQASDLWLFVTDRTSVRGAPASALPSLATVNRATTATWTRDNMIYTLVTDGDEALIRRFL